MTSTTEATSTTEEATSSTTTDVPSTTVPTTSTEADTTEKDTTTVMITTSTTTEEPTSTTTVKTTTTTLPTTTTTTEIPPTTSTTEKSTTTEKQTTTTTEEPTTTTTTQAPTTSTTTETPTTTTEQQTTTTSTETPTTTTTTEIPTTTTTTETPPTTTTTTETPTTTSTTAEPTTTPSTTTTTTTEPTTTTTTTEPTTTTTTTTEMPTTSTTTTTTENPTTTTETTTITTTTTTPPPTTSTTTEPTTTTENPTTSTTSTEPPTTTTTTEASSTTTTTTTTPAPTTTTEPTTSTTKAPPPTTEPTTTTTTTKPTTTTTEPPPLTTTTAKSTTTTTTTEATTTTTPKPTTTTQIPTTTTTVTTTTLEPTTPGPRTGKFYNETGDYYYPNMMRNATPTDPAAEIKLTNGPIGFGWAINLDGNAGERDPRLCLLFKDVPKNKEDRACWDNPAECSKGFSFSIWEKVTFWRDDPIERCIYSTGGDAEGNPGLSLSFRGIFFFVVVSTGSEVWNLTAPGPVPNNTWSEIGVRWSPGEGLEMFVDGQMKATVRYPRPITPPKARSVPMAMTVGCRKTADGEFGGFAHGEYDELTAWLWSLDEEQEHFFTGGYDKDKTCDPETHPMNCETNPEKILARMKDVELNSVGDLCSALDHLKLISDVEEDPPRTEKDKDGIADSKNKEDLMVMVNIVENVMEKTKNKPSNMGESDLKNLMDGASSSVEFVSRVSDWQLKKTTQTDKGREPMAIDIQSSIIVSSISKMMLYDLLASGEPISFPSSEKKTERRRKRRSEKEGEEEDQDEEGPNAAVQVTNEMFGELPKSDKVCFLGNSYKNLDKIAPLQNKKSGNDTTLVFIDSEIISVASHPNVSSGVLDANPVIIKLRHRRKVKATGRKLLANKDLQENGEVRQRQCVRFDSTLNIKGMTSKGGWTPDSCTIQNSTAVETVCKCTQLGMYAVMAKIRKPFDIPPEAEWVKITKWIGYGLSVILLFFYMMVIIFRGALHEQFHIIRLNLAGAAVGALSSFCVSAFMYEDEDVCRVLSLLIHFFYTAVGTWLTADAHALFSALVNGSFGGKFTCYVMIGWIVPGGLIGGCLTLFSNYGYDYRCLVGPTAGMRWLLVSPILISSVAAFTFSLLTLINYGTPAVKKTVIVNELSTVARGNFIVVVLFLTTWVCGVFALVDLGFDGGEIPAFNPIFQILNSCLGIFIVIFIGLGSKYFRYCLCHSSRSRTQTKALYMDPFDVHDQAIVVSKMKIYVS